MQNDRKAKKPRKSFSPSTKKATFAADSESEGAEQAPEAGKTGDAEKNSACRPPPADNEPDASRKKPFND
ncbi:MAG: hypothetical protein J1F06_02760 [Prevotellaceae bacterium]|nr:hypothetical protein [Prevotellaceae bacterium]